MVVKKAVSNPPSVTRSKNMTKNMRLVNTGRVAMDIAIPQKQAKKGVKLLSNGKVDVEYMRAKDNELVTGIFRYHELPGGCLEFVFRKYKGDPVEKYNLYDGQVYTIPIGVAKHLNSNCSYPQYEYIKGEEGVTKVETFGQNMFMKVTSWIRRCSFQSLELTDEHELELKPELIRVEAV